MDRGKAGRGDFFGDPFAGFGGFGGGRSFMSNFFGGRDPFDDPFFTRPFGGVFGSGPFGHSMFGNEGRLFGDSTMPMFIEDDDTVPEVKKSKGPVIQELSSEDEGETDEKNGEENANNEPFIEHPDDEIEEWGKPRQLRNEYSMGGRVKPSTQKFKFHSSSVTYGGANGAYYTSSTTRRKGNDGVTIEESKEADTTTREATHRILRGIHDKGHSFTRRLNSDGKVNTVQTLHNLNEDELGSFEESWKGKAKQHLPGWDEGFNMNGGSNASGQNKQGSHGWALPPARGDGETRDGLFHKKSIDSATRAEKKSPSIRRIHIDEPRKS